MMSCFYRFKTVMDYYSENPALALVGIHSEVQHYSAGDIEREFTEIELNPPWEKTKMYRAPMARLDYLQSKLIYATQGQFDFPEVWPGGGFPLVSERVKGIIESFDDFEHQFCETAIWNQDKQPINQGTYYAMHIRRFLKIEETDAKLENTRRMFRPTYMEERVLPTVQRCEPLKDRIAQLPLWRHRLEHGIFYMSEPLLMALRQAGVTGLKDYSDTYDGLPYEAVARFY